MGIPRFKEPGGLPPSQARVAKPSARSVSNATYSAAAEPAAKSAAEPAAEPAAKPAAKPAVAGEPAAANEPAAGDGRDYQTWAQKHAPRTLGELAMHPAKLAELERALDPRSQWRVVVLSGPAGSSKSTAARLVAASRGQRVVEFQAAEATVGSTSLVNSFRDFLLGCAIFDREEAVILVEELPSVFHEETRAEFEDALLAWAEDTSLVPTVCVCFTEIEVSARYSEALVVPRVLGRLVNADPRARVVWVKTNAVNVTLLQKCLKLVAGREGFGVPGGELRTLAQSGDVRSALNALEVQCRYPQPGRKTAKEALWVRGSPVELFYAIGKVVWTSSKEGTLEESLAAFEESMDTFNLTVLENYTSAKHQRLPPRAAAEVAEWLSLADLGSANAALGAYGAAVAIKHSAEVESRPKRFVQTRFTQYPRWRAETHLRIARLQRLARSRRQHLEPASTAALLDHVAYEAHFPSRSSSLPPDDSDSDF